MNKKQITETLRTYFDGTKSTKEYFKRLEKIIGSMYETVSNSKYIESTSKPMVMMQMNEIISYLKKQSQEVR